MSRSQPPSAPATQHHHQARACRFPPPRPYRNTRHHALQSREPAAGGCAAHELCAHPVDRLYDVEGPLRHHRFAVPDRRRPLRLYGACIPARRPTLSVEPKRAERDASGRGGSLRGARQGHPDCPPNCSQVWQRREGAAPDQGRQQPFRRHGAVRQGAGLPSAQGHHRQRCGVHAVCWVCDDSPVGAPLAQDGDAGNHGSLGGVAAGIDVEGIRRQGTKDSERAMWRTESYTITTESGFDTHL